MSTSGIVSSTRDVNCLDDAPAVSDDSVPAELWFREEEKWELTWPIWHMLPRSERKTLASKHGFETIGEFEEYMTLQRAVGASSEQKSYDNNMAYGVETKGSADIAYQSKVENKKRVVSDEDDDGSDTDDKLYERIYSERAVTTETLSKDELIKAGGLILLLPDEMLHRIFDWLSVDAYANLALVSPHWKSFTRTEAVYKRLCERLYLNQSKRRTLHVSRFQNSYHTMLHQRPRVRAGGGVYVLKYTRVKHIQRDMWTEVPKGAVLEMVYYRYLYFQEDGRVLYALTPAPPHEMIRRFLKVCLSPRNYADPVAVWGTYQVQKRTVTVTARQEWQYVRLVLTIQPTSPSHERFGLLSFDRHITSTSGMFDNQWALDRITFQVPEEQFRFVKDHRL